MSFTWALFPPLSYDGNDVTAANNTESFMTLLKRGEAQSPRHINYLHQSLVSRRPPSLGDAGPFTSLLLLLPRPSRSRDEGHTSLISFLMHVFITWSEARFSSPGGLLGIFRSSVIPFFFFFFFLLSSKFFWNLYLLLSRVLCTIFVVEWRRR